MSIALELTASEPKRLREAALRRGVKPEALARDLVVETLPASLPNQQDPLLGHGHTRRQVDRGRGLPDAAFLVGNRDDATHRPGRFLSACPQRFNLALF